MAEAHFQMITPGMDPFIGPEELAIPAEPEVLRHAVSSFRELSQTLSGVADQLHQDAGADAAHGMTTSEVTSITKRNSRRARRDADKLEEIAQATEKMAESVGNIQSHELPAIRSKWRQAREAFREELGGGLMVAMSSEAGGPEKRLAHEPPHQQHVPLNMIRQYIRHLDDDLIEPHEKILVKMIGRYNIRGNLDEDARQVMFVSGPVQTAMHTYKQTVGGLLDEYSDLAHRALRLEQDIRDKASLGHELHAATSEGEGGSGHGGDTISGPRALRHLTQGLRAAAHAYDQVHDQFDNAARHLIDGLLPDRDGNADNSFISQWRDYLARRRHRLRTVCQKVDDVIDELLRIDAQCANALRS